MSNYSRRSFLRSAAAAGAAAVTLPALVRGEQTAAAKSSPALPPLTIPVDWHSHIVTAGEIAFLAGRSVAPRVRTGADGKTLIENVTTVSAASRGSSPISPSDLVTRLQHLDANRVERQLLTYTVANGYEATLPVEELRVFYRTLNDDLAAALRAHPGRFLGVAAVPTADPVWAAGELERAHRELGLIGAALPLNAFATLAGARTLAPLFAAGQKFRSHFFIHRAPASAQIPGQPPLIVPEDTESVRWSIISNTHLANGAVTLGLTDFLDPYPDVSVQVIMLGGFLPYLIDSITAAGSRLKVKDPLAKLRRLYFDPGPYSSSAGEWVALAARKLGADRILFGTDYGVGGGTSADRLAPSIATLDAILPADARQQIYRENSLTLLKIKGIT
jgi:predicted TIM-barrel fold metal-dependent hydrolase